MTRILVTSAVPHGARCLALTSVLLASGCFSGDRPNYPSREQVIEAAARCGIEGFEPTNVGAGIAAYVSPTIKDAEQKEDCIYDNLRGRGYLVTR